MRFLIDEDLPRSSGDLIRRYGHDAVDVRDIGLKGAKDHHLQQEDLLARIPGRLAIVEPGRVRIRSG